MTEEKNKIQETHEEELLEEELLEKELELEEEVELVEETDQDLLPGISLTTFNQLTNKNRQFIINVDKKLADELSEGVKEQVYHEMVETLIDGQQSSQTARQIYGTPTETAKLILDQEFAEPTADGVKSPDWQIALDGGLMLGSIYTLITGVSIFSASDDQAVAFMGIISLLINYIIAGFSMLMTSKVMPDVDAPKGKRGIWRYIIVSMAAMLLWFTSIAVSSVLIPVQFNPTLSGEVYLIIGAITLGLRFLVKRQLNIKGGVF